MYCYQCEQTANGTGCNKFGVCGKDPATADLQDLLVHATKGISMYAHRAARLGASDREVDRKILEFLFATVTNVDFDPERLRGHLLDAAKVRDRAKSLYEAACAKQGKKARGFQRRIGLDAGRRFGRSCSGRPRAYRSPGGRRGWATT